ncbi:acyl-CoA dehydratase activase-related protein [Alistipes sp. OttesenSCG-928-B03]|nr:acyl-CoA dehydratase activase-related protein [Alistipes sp. OttesenSCG-928-B03]
MKTYRIGLDVGSTTAKIAVTDSDGTLLHSDYQRHHANVGPVVAAFLEAVLTKLGNAEAHITVTGSVGMGLAERFSLPFVQEVVAATRFVKKLHPEISTIIDIGGEDAKIVYLNPNGNADLRMNGNCAGGTGAFIDQMAVLLGVGVDELDDLAGRAERKYPIAARCGVFSKTDVQNLISKNVSREDIAASVFQAVTVQTVVTLSHGCRITPKLLFCGGPLTFIPALRHAFMEYLELTEDDIIVPEKGNLIPAWGAALSAGEGAPVAIGGLLDGLRQADAGGLKRETGMLAPIFGSEEEYAAWRERKNGRHIVRRPLDGYRGAAFLGIDSGSTTTKIVVTDPDDRILFSHYAPNGGNPIESVKTGLDELRRECAAAGAELNIAGSCSTGYGEDLIKAAFGLKAGIIETIAHFAAAQKIDPEVSFILDIGGQDMKAIFIENGILSRMELNEACSSGCGSFIDTFAQTMGLGVEEFSRAACTATNPCDLGTRCTVFMNSKVKQVMREGASVGDIAAGLSYSVVKNCLYKVLKLKKSEELGSHIVVQGGTMRNDSVVGALEKLAGVEVGRSDMPELMGAYGCALYAAKMAADEAKRRQTEVAGEPQLAEGLTSGSPKPATQVSVASLIDTAGCTTRSSTCGGCENRCYVQKYSFANGNTYFSGNKCENFFTNRGEQGERGRNLSVEKYSLLFDRAADATLAFSPQPAECQGRIADELQPSAPDGYGLPDPQSGTEKENGAANTRSGDEISASCPPDAATASPTNRESHATADANCEKATSEGAPLTLGIPRALNVFENYPFWHALFAACGIRTVLSAPSTFARYEAGVHSVMSDNICFPAKLVHSHIYDLIDMGVDRIFFPYVVFEKLEGKGVKNSYNCPIVAGYSEVVKSAIEPPVPVDAPVFTFKDPDLLAKCCTTYLSGLGVDKKTIKQAIKAATAAQEEYEREIKRRNVEAFERARAQGGITILLAGRPYHTDPVVQHKLSDMIAGMGVTVVTEDIVRDDPAPAEKSHHVSQWSYINRILRAAHWVAAEGNDVHFVQMTSFGCGPDAFLLDEVKAILERRGKALTMLKIDDVNNIGSLRLRVRSVVESLRFGHTVARKDEPFRTTKVYTKDDRRRTILIPYFTDYVSPLIPAVFRLAGYNAVALPESDQTSAEYGLMYANNEVCYPATLVVGDLIKALDSGQYDPDRTAVIMTQTGGQCRASNYIALIKKGMTEAGFGHVPVLSMALGSGLTNEQHGFTIPWAKVLRVAVAAVLFSDTLSKFYHPSAVRERKPGAARKLRAHYLAQAERCIERNDHKALYALIPEAAQAFNEITVPDDRPRVGVVGEIFLKFNSFAHKRVCEWLTDNGIEVMPPILIDFFVQSFVNKRVKRETNVAKGGIPQWLNDAAYSWIWKKIRYVNHLASHYRYYVPLNDIFESAEHGREIISLSCQYGEGWLLPAEVVGYAKMGVNNVISLQPFGCIANHIVSKGVEKRIKKQYPQMNLLSLDFDSGVSDVNITNRLMLLTANIK